MTTYQEKVDALKSSGIINEEGAKRLLTYRSNGEPKPEMLEFVNAQYPNIPKQKDMTRDEMLAHARAGLGPFRTNKLHTRTDEGIKQYLDENGLSTRVPKTRDKTRDEMLEELRPKLGALIYHNAAKPGTDQWIKELMKQHNLSTTQPWAPERASPPRETRSMKQIDQSDYLRDAASEKLIGNRPPSATRGVPPGRSILKSPAKVAPPISKSAKPIFPSPVQTSAPKPRSGSPLAQQVRQSIQQAEERRSSSTPRDEINDFSDTLTRPKSPGKGVSFNPDIGGLEKSLAHISGEGGRINDSVVRARAQSPYITPPEEPESIKARENQIAEIEKKLENAKTVDMRNMQFDSPNDGEKLRLQKIVEGHNIPRTYFKDSGYIPRNKLQQKADADIAKANPSSKKELEYQELLQSTLKPILDKNIASDAAAPFLERLAQDPDKYHEKLMGKVERDYLDTIDNRATREFNEKILPGIRSKYQTPGLRQHGHMGRDIGNAAELAQRGRVEALAGARKDIRGLTLNAGLQHAALQGQGASVAGKTAEIDSKNKQDAIKTSAQLRSDHQTKQELYRQTESGIGAVLHAEDKEKQRMERAHALQAETDTRMDNEKLVEQIGKQPASRPTTSMDLQQKGDPTQGNNKKGLAKMLGGMGRNTLSGGDGDAVEKAKGGLIKNKRVKRAEGGSVDSMSEEAIQNALTQHTDPLAELRRLFNVDIRKKNPWKTKQYYALGGQVSPIQLGAEEAKRFVGESALRKQVERMREKPKKKSRWLEILDAGMNSAAGEGNGAIGTMASGWKSDFDSETARNKAKEEKLSKADELEYKLESDIQKSKVDQRKLDNEEQLNKAKMAHYAQKASAASGQTQSEVYPEYDIEGDKSTPELPTSPDGKMSVPKSESGPMTPNRKLASHDKKMIIDNGDEFGEAEELVDTAIEAGDQFNKVEGNQFLSGVNTVLGNTAASLAGRIIGNKGKAEDIRQTNTVGHKLIGKLNQKEGAAGKIAAAVNSRIAAKPEYGLERKFNVSQSDQYAEEGLKAMKKSIENDIFIGTPDHMIKAKIKKYQEKKAKLGLVKKARESAEKSHVIYVDKPVSKMTADEIKDKLKG